MHYYKLGIAAGIFALNFISNSVISWLIIKKKTSAQLSIQSQMSAVLAGLRSIAAGLLCGLCFLDLLPSIHEYFEEYFKSFTNLNIPLPAVVNGSFILSFILMWALDTAMHWLSHYVDSRRKVAVSSPRQVAYLNEDNENQHVISKSEPRDSRTKYSGITLGGDNNNKEEIMQTSFHSSIEGSQTVKESSCEAGASELTNSQKGKTALLRTILLLTALSVHAFFEGLAIGLAEELHATLTLSLVIACHEPLALFSSLSGYVTSEGSTLKIALIISACYSLVVPSGVILGTVIVDITLDQLVLGIFMSLASGAVFFVVFIEMLPLLTGSKLLKMGYVILFFLCGFGLLMVITYVTGHHHDHSHSDHFNVTIIP